MSFITDLWSGITGSGGKPSQTSSQAGGYNNTGQQFQQGSQQQDQWQNQYNNQTQQQQMQQLASALQQLSGFGQTTGQQQYQYGLAPQGQAALDAQRGLSQQLQGGGNNFNQMLYNPAASQGAQSAIGGMSQAATDLYQQNMKPQIDSSYTKSGMFGSSPWAAEQARGLGSLSNQLAGQAAGVYGQQQNLGMQGLLSQLQGWGQLAGMSPQAVQMGQQSAGGQQYGQTGGSQTSALGTGLQSGVSTGGMTGGATGSQTGMANQVGSGSSYGNASGQQNIPGSVVGGLQNLVNLFGGGSGSTGANKGMLPLLMGG